MQYMAESVSRGYPSDPEAAGTRRYLFGPAADFLGLGGGSLFVLLALAMLIPADQYKPTVGAVMLVVINFINHPHFAHSYQVFYRGFRDKALGDAFPSGLRARYLVAGIVVPILLFAFMAYAVAAASPRLVGMSANLMAFLVGWHYVKQGYGMLIVDSVLRSNYFSGRAKQALLVNAYACWAASWAYANQYIAERQLWNLHYYTFDLPDPLVHALGAVAAGTALWALVALQRKWRETPGNFPLNGSVAYLASLYAWMLFVRVNPLFIVVMPTFHSLQYLVVVWRYRLNLEASRRDARETIDLPLLRSGHFTKAGMRFAGFVATGTLLGFVGFWVIPLLLDQAVDYDHALFGSNLFLFGTWVFINVHHYFIDNVIWRRENPETRRYVFGRA